MKAIEKPETLRSLKEAAIVVECANANFTAKWSARPL